MPASVTAIAVEIVLFLDEKHVQKCSLSVHLHQKLIISKKLTNF